MVAKMAVARSSSVVLRVGCTRTLEGFEPRSIKRAHPPQRSFLPVSPNSPGSLYDRSSRKHSCTIEWLARPLDRGAKDRVEHSGRDFLDGPTHGRSGSRRGDSHRLLRAVADERFL
jgi:hypothetical protein